MKKKQPSFLNIILMKSTNSWNLVSKSTTEAVPNFPDPDPDPHTIKRKKTYKQR